LHEPKQEIALGRRGARKELREHARTRRFRSGAARRDDLRERRVDVLQRERPVLRRGGIERLLEQRIADTRSPLPRLARQIRHADRDLVRRQSLQERRHRSDLRIAAGSFRDDARRIGEIAEPGHPAILAISARRDARPATGRHSAVCGYFVALATAVSKGAALGLRAVWRMTMSGGSVLLR
jgi:hypothetical protein